MLVRLRHKGQLTIPEEIRRSARISEGDYMEVFVRGASIVLEPRTVVDASQAWFWTDAWQAGEQEASADIQAGNTRRFESDKDFIDSLG